MPKKKKRINRLLQIGNPKEYDNQGNIVYPGRLGKPREYKKYLSLINDNSDSDDIGKVTDAVMSEDMEILHELMEYFEINSNSPDCWFQLAYSLAQEHVPFFFHYDRRKGRPKSKTPLNDIQLYLAVQRKVKEKKCSVSEACGHIRKDFPSYKDGKSINTRFYEAKKRLEDREYLDQAIAALTEEQARQILSNDY